MPEKVTLIVFSGEMDKALAAFNIAIGAASMGISKEAFIPEIDSFAGVATYLAEAKEGRGNLFI